MLRLSNIIGWEFLQKGFAYFDAEYLFRFDYVIKT